MYWKLRYVLKYTEFDFIKGSGKETIIFSGYSKNKALILGQPEQQFKIYSDVGIFHPLFGLWQWYYETASQDNKHICELFVNISFLYSMK